MDSDVAVEVIRILPSILWIVFFAVLVALFQKPIREQLLPRLGGFSAFGVSLTFLREELDRAVEQRTAQVSQGDRSLVLRRAQAVADALQDGQILWVDDEPENNAYERRILRSFGVLIDPARSTDEALAMLRGGQYHAVISDMTRGGAPHAGLQLLEHMREEGLYRWFIIYAGHFDPAKGIPPYVFGMTDRPDHLLHYVMDVLERERS
jgi:CheY-like chemotaxis protein